MRSKVTHLSPLPIHFFTFFAAQSKQPRAKPERVALNFDQHPAVVWVRRIDQQIQLRWLYERGHPQAEAVCERQPIQAQGLCGGFAVGGAAVQIQLLCNHPFAKPKVVAQLPNGLTGNATLKQLAGPCVGKAGQTCAHYDACGRWWRIVLFSSLQHGPKGRESSAATCQCAALTSGNRCVLAPSAAPRECGCRAGRRTGRAPRA